MKTLFLLRHAKSSWHNSGQQDFDRPLNERGKQAAPLIGKFMRAQKFQPELIICSPAERARQTIALVIKAATLKTDLRYDERIYEASVENLFAVISQVEDNIAKLMLVGHNPGMEALLLALTGETHHLPTAALAGITVHTDRWSKLQEQKGRLEILVKAKELMMN